MSCSVAGATNDDATWPALDKAVQQAAALWQDYRQKLARFVGHLQLMSASPTAIVSHHRRVRRQRDNGRRDLELFRIHKIPRSCFRPQFQHCHSLLQQLWRNLSCNLFRADFVFRLC